MDRGGGEVDAWWVPPSSLQTSFWTTREEREAMRVRCTAGVHTHTDDTTVRDCRSHTEPKFTHSGEQLRAQRRRCSLQVSLSSANLGASSGRRSGQRVRKRPAGSAGLSLALHRLSLPRQPPLTPLHLCGRGEPRSHAPEHVGVVQHGGVAEVPIAPVRRVDEVYWILLPKSTHTHTHTHTHRSGSVGAPRGRAVYGPSVCRGAARVQRGLVRRMPLAHQVRV